MDGPKDVSPRVVRVYVDGWNLFYRALKGTKYKWLNLAELVRQGFPGVYRIQKLLYFTSRVLGKPPGTRYKRQQTYLNALRKLPKLEEINVQIIEGRMRPSTIRRPLANLPVGGAEIVPESPIALPGAGRDHPVLREGDYMVGKDKRVLRVRETLEGVIPDRSNQAPSQAIHVAVDTVVEKHSDVNLATHLLNDAWKDEYDIAVVVTGDTDFVTPIRIVKEDLGKEVHVLCPGKHARVAPKLRKAASTARHIQSSWLRNAQFPECIPGTNICRPLKWSDRRQEK